ncbi:MAG: hypothetical protein ACE5GX_03225 [Thermoanaerobaculia bacterium]
MSGRTKNKSAAWIAGTGEAGPLSEDERSIPEMVLVAVEAALEDAGLGFDDINAVVTASVDLFDGLTASNVAVTEVVGAVMKPETRVAADGLCAAIHAVCQIHAGAYDTVLVVAHGKASMASYEQLTPWAMDPVYLQPVGVNFLVCAGLQAHAVAEGDETAERAWAELAAQRRRDAARQRVAPPLTAEEVLDSPVVASPLRRGMCAPTADGACAVVLRGQERDGSAHGPFVTGVGYDLSPHAPGDRDLTEWEGLRRACDRAYGMARLTDPATAFDLLEPSCLYTHEEWLFASASRLGAGTTISPGGGLFAGAVPVAAGLSRLVAADRWLRKQGGPRRALVHGTWGPAGQGQAVTVLEAAA